MINLSKNYFYIYSHLVGMFYRTIRMLENGIKPVYVFDGTPPSFKAGEVPRTIKKFSFTYPYVMNSWKKDLKREEKPKLV